MLARPNTHLPLEPVGTAALRGTQESKYPTAKPFKRLIGPRCNGCQTCTHWHPKGWRSAPSSGASVASPGSGRIWRRPNSLRGDACSVLDRVPLKRMGRPSEVAQFANDICSPLTSFLTGELIIFDSGMTLGS